MAIVTIDGNELEVADGTLILEAAQTQGISIPTFCYQERLSPLASCRMCLIEIEGQFAVSPDAISGVAGIIDTTATMATGITVTGMATGDRDRAGITGGTGIPS